MPVGRDERSGKSSGLSSWGLSVVSPGPWSCRRLGWAMTQQPHGPKPGKKHQWGTTERFGCTRKEAISVAGGENEWLLSIREELYTAVLSDILDARGLRSQALEPGFGPVTSAQRIVGRAFPILVVETFTLPDRPYDKLIEALDTIGSGEVVMTNALSDRAAFWGELLSTACHSRGAAGAIVDGLVRDVERIEPIGFPVLARGFRPVDSLGRFEVLAYRTEILSGGVLVRPGDLVVGDRDGVVVVPQDVEREVVRDALEKVRGENIVREGIRQGKSLRSLFDAHGVL